MTCTQGKKQSVEIVPEQYHSRVIPKQAEIMKTGVRANEIEKNNRISETKIENINKISKS